MTYSHIKPDEMARLQTFLETGVSYRDIQAALGRDKATISYHAKRLGLSRSTIHRLPADEIVAIRKLRSEERLSVADIAARTKVGYRKVAGLVKDDPLLPDERLAITRKKHARRWPRGNTALMQRLIRERGRQCETKGCRWTRTLELHHKDGNRANTKRDNLLILCPNHHSITPNYRNKGRRAHNARP